jgi:hypothetical protein
VFDALGRMVAHKSVAAPNPQGTTQPLDLTSVGGRRVCAAGTHRRQPGNAPRGTRIAQVTAEGKAKKARHLKR